MFKNLKSYLKIFLQLLKMDLVIFKRNAISGILDTVIWLSIILFVVSYIFPLLGMTKDFGQLWLIGAIVSCCVFAVWGYAVSFVADKEGNKTISYLLTLPVPSWIIFLKFIVMLTIETITYTLIILPLGKLLLWNRLDLSELNPPKFIHIAEYPGCFQARG